MKRCFLLLMAVAIFSVTGCAYDKPVFVEWGNSVTPFLIKLEGDADQGTVMTEDLLSKSMIGNRRVQITYRWQKLGRGVANGKYMPNERLLLVDRNPITREWTAETAGGTAKRDQAIWVESSDSVGFSTGISITARILDNSDAVKFLFNYPAQRNVVTAVNNSYKDDYVAREVGLEDVMDSEIRARVQKVFAEEAAVVEMDDLRGRKNDIIKAVEADIIPFFKGRGITITTVTMFGGFTYENPLIQSSIDKVFQAQQDKNVAIAEADAARERKEALKLKGEGIAAQVVEKAKGEALAVQTIADAKAYELQKLNENPEAYVKLKQLEIQQNALDVWDGRYPVFLMSGDGGPNMLLTIPRIDDLPKAPPNTNKARHDAAAASAAQ